MVSKNIQNCMIVRYLIIVLVMGLGGQEDALMFQAYVNLTFPNLIDVG